MRIGKDLYATYCARCHGTGLAVSSPAFFDLRLFPKEDRARFDRSVRDGKRAMPAWRGVLQSQEQLDGLWAYIGSVNKWSD